MEACDIFRPWRRDRPPDDIQRCINCRVRQQNTGAGEPARSRSGVPNSGRNGARCGVARMPMRCDPERCESVSKSSIMMYRTVSLYW